MRPAHQTLLWFLALGLVFNARSARADPQIIRVGEDTSSHVRQVQAMMKRYRFSPLNAIRAPEFYAPDISGGTLGLASLRNDWVLLVFFATWCGPCAQEMPTLNSFSRAATGTLRVVAIAVDSPENDVAPYARRFGLQFPVLYDARKSVARSYGVTAFPTAFVLEPGGKLVGTVRGGLDWQRVEPMLKEIKRLKL